MTYVDGPAARREAEAELARPIYAEAQPNLFERILEWFGELINGLLESTASGPGRGILLIVAAAVVAVLVWAALRWRSSSPSRSRVFDEPAPLHPADYEGLARGAWREHRYDDVVINAARGLVRARQSAGQLPEDAGLTVAEAILPDEQEAVVTLFSTFSDVRYGARQASQEQAAQALAVLQVPV